MTRGISKSFSYRYRLHLTIFSEFIQANTLSVTQLSSISWFGFVILPLDKYVAVVETLVGTFIALTLVMPGYVTSSQTRCQISNLFFSNFSYKCIVYLPTISY